jgi:NADP-dependent 3-hydroxy acid dehydrogenase YdfG
MGVIVKGVWQCMKAEVPAMLESGGGAIVNMSSIAGVVARPSPVAPNKPDRRPTRR